MLNTAEIRWFVRGALPEGVSDWYGQACPNASCQEPRLDHYLSLPESDSVGVKLREGLLEVKRKDGELGLLQPHDHVEGHGNSWTKWSFPASLAEGHPGDLTPDAPGWIAVAKTRWLALLTFSPDGVVEDGGEGPTCGRGCWVELTEVRIADETWWSIGLEAVGPMEGLGHDLLLGARHLCSLGDPPILPAHASFSYPRFLRYRAEGRI